MPTNSIEGLLLYGDAHLIAFNKPGGMPVQPDTTGDPSLLELVRLSLPAATPLGLPHRLDRPVSGVVVLTRSAEVLPLLSRAFADHAVQKTYWAIVTGDPGPAGRWTHRLVHDPRQHRARVVADAKRGHDVQVSFKRSAVGDRYTLLELQPDGGRFHQLRAQCAAAGHPIKGDVKYGARRGEPDRTIGLHARSLVFDHPITGERLRIVAPAPATGLWPRFVPPGPGEGTQ